MSVYAKPKAFKSSGSLRKLVLIRGGERVDKTFKCETKDWLDDFYDQQGRRIGLNTNLPAVLPMREGGVSAYRLDPPMTAMGCLQCELIGEALAAKVAVIPPYIYVSPAYRCLQAAQAIVKGLDDKGNRVKLNVESGLCEWTYMYDGTLPIFLSERDRENMRYKVNAGYQPVEPRPKAETLDEYYERSHRVMRALLAKQPPAAEYPLILVAHGMSLETCSRQLLGHPQRGLQDFAGILDLTPYLSTLCLQQMLPVKSWMLTVPPVPAMTYEGNVNRLFL